MQLEDRRGPQLVVRDYNYIQNRLNNNIVYYKCRFYGSLKCLARCTVKENKVILSGRHIHPPNYNRNENITIVNQFWCKVSFVDKK